MAYQCPHTKMLFPLDQKSAYESHLARLRKERAEQRKEDEVPAHNIVTNNCADRPKWNDAHDNQRLQVGLQRDREQGKDNEQCQQNIFTEARGNLAALKLFTAQSIAYAREQVVATTVVDA